jgi:integrase
MRHADVSTTLKIYTHVMRHRREGVAERLDELVFGG